MNFNYHELTPIDNNVVTLIDLIHRTNVEQLKDLHEDIVVEIKPHLLTPQASVMLRKLATRVEHIVDTDYTCTLPGGDVVKTSINFNLKDTPNIADSASDQNLARLALDHIYAGDYSNDLLALTVANIIYHINPTDKTSTVFVDWFSNTSKLEVTAIIDPVDPLQPMNKRPEKLKISINAAIDGGFVSAEAFTVNPNTDNLFDAAVEASQYAQARFIKGYEGSADDVAYIFNSIIAVAVTTYDCSLGKDYLNYIPVREWLNSDTTGK